MIKRKLSFRSKLILILLPFIIIVGVSIYSTRNLLFSLSNLSLKSIEGAKVQTLLNYAKDLDSSFNSLSYSGKDAILKQMSNEDSPADGFISSLEVFDGQLSQLTGQLSSIHQEQQAKTIKDNFEPIHLELLKWGNDLNTKKTDAKNANTEFMTIRKKLKKVCKRKY